MGSPVSLGGRCAGLARTLGSREARGAPSVCECGHLSRWPTHGRTRRSTTRPYVQNRRRPSAGPDRRSGFGATRPTALGSAARATAPAGTAIGCARSWPRSSAGARRSDNHARSFGALVTSATHGHNQRRATTPRHSNRVPARRDRGRRCASGAAPRRCRGATLLVSATAEPSVAPEARARQDRDHTAGRARRWRSARASLLACAPKCPAPPCSRPSADEKARGTHGPSCREQPACGCRRPA